MSWESTGYLNFSIVILNCVLNSVLEFLQAIPKLLKHTSNDYGISCKSIISNHNISIIWVRRDV